MADFPRWPLLGVLILAVAATGCRSLPSATRSADRIATVEILAPVSVPANRARTRFQAGRAVYAADPYVPWCELEISTVAEQPQEVKRDVFVVTATGTGILSDPESRLPVFGPFVDLACGDRVYYEVEYWLASDLQPGVRKVRCLQAFNACYDPAWYPGRDAIAEALGPAFIIR